MAVLGVVRTIVRRTIVDSRTRKGQRRARASCDFAGARAQAVLSAPAERTGTTPWLTAGLPDGRPGDVLSG
jgi:formylmethanofuran:tetrahydromethanopterin formyltransferase